MEVEVKDTQDGERTPLSPLSDLFPGSTVALSDGTIVTVRKWSARDVAREVPAIFGRILSKVGTAVKDPANLDVQLPWLLSKAAGEVLELIAFTTRLPVSKVEELPADEMMMLARMMVEQNKSFFAEAAKLYQTVKQELPGT
jgi:hypothetical protein